MDGVRYIVLGKYMLLSVRGRSVRGGGGAVCEVGGWAGKRGSSTKIKGKVNLCMKCYVKIYIRVDA